MREGNRRKGPILTTIRRLVDRFRREGSVCGSVPRRTRLMRPRSAIALVRRAVTRTPTLSVRKLSRRTGVPRSTVQLILRKWLGLYPYKVQVVHKQKRGNKAKRMRLCSWLLPRLSESRFPRFFFMSDEGSSVPEAAQVAWGAEAQDPQSRCRSDVLSAVGKGLVARCRACLRQRGGHLEHVGT